MFQQFYTDTLMSRYIKSMLTQTPIYLYDCVRNGDLMIQGQYYIYKEFVIRCDESGRLLIDSEQEAILYPSFTLFPSQYLFPGSGLKSATITVIDYIDSFDTHLFDRFVSNTSYYDSDTHVALGQHLRYLRAVEGLNLMPYYNCYSGLMLTDIELAAQDKLVTVSRVSVTKYKVVAVPIKLGKSYTIAVDCPTPVYMRAVIHDTNRFIAESELDEQIREDLGASGKQFSRLRFSDPVTYTFEPSLNSLKLSHLSKDLYLVIQLPQNNTSSIVVLEDMNIVDGIHCDKQSVRIRDSIKPALLEKNYFMSFAFSDRLVEYLLGNVVSEQDAVHENIEKIQHALANKYPSYKSAFITGRKRYGIFDEDLPRYIQKLVEEEAPIYYQYDQDGNVNKEIEILLKLEGGEY